MKLSQLHIKPDLPHMKLPLPHLNASLAIAALPRLRTNRDRPFCFAAIAGEGASPIEIASALDEQANSVYVSDRPEDKVSAATAARLARWQSKGL